jgi:hypothetical protein
MYIKYKENMRLKIIILLLLPVFIAISCKKLVETDKPANKITAKEAWATNASAASILTKVYSDMSASAQMSGGGGISFLSGLLADELTLYVPQVELNTFYVNDVQSKNETFLFWSSFYNYIYTANDACEQLPVAKNISDQVKNQLTGEAKFIRAFCYFYLVNYFGAVPLLTSTDYQVNRLATRVDPKEVYKQIITDLQDAQTLLNEDYMAADVVNITTERVRPNKATATALLARAFLYTGDYVNAEIQATAVIENSKYELLSNLNEVFLANSKEAIWQLQPVVPNRNTKDGDAFILLGVPDFESPAALSPQLIAAFENKDERRVNWINEVMDGTTYYYYAYKYKIGRNLPEPQALSEYLMVFRLSEQYLIRAEARAHQNKLNGPSSAESDLNIIRTRAGLNEIQPPNQTAMLNALEHERQVELFTEWGHRWLDLKRTNWINDVMNNIAAIKGGTWSINKSLLPIPFESIQYAPGLRGKQNPGYE